MTSKAEQDVLAERQRQIDVDGWTPEHNDKHKRNELGLAASLYAFHDNVRTLSITTIPVYWPWSDEWWKPKSYRENLVRAGALIIAEIERIDREEKDND